MNRVAQAQHRWMGQRLALLGGSAAAAGIALVLQVARLRLDPAGAAVHGVALFVTLVVFILLLRLVRLQVSGPGLEAPSWERHTHRASVKEAPLVGLIGAAVAVFVTVATPRLVLERPGASSSPVAVAVADVDRTAPVPAAAVKERPARYAPGLSVLESNALASGPAIEVNYRWLEGGQEEPPQDPLQEPVDPTRPDRNAILRVQRDEPPLPPVHFSVGAIVATTTGSVDLGGASGRFEAGLESMRGEQAFEMGIDVTAEFALTSESALKFIYGGVSVFERGHLTGDTELGSVTAPAGSDYQFEMTWSHLYVALSKRLVGYTSESWFDFSVHGGAIIDHTLTEFASDAAGVEAETVDGERGWFSPGLGFSATVRGPGPAGFYVEFLNSLPVNLGGQAILLTDVRGGLTADLVEGGAVSLFLGYRYVRGTYRLYEDPLVREGGRTAAELAMRGPAFGLDFRF